MLKSPIMIIKKGLLLMSTSRIDSKLSSKVSKVPEDWLSYTNKGNYTLFLQSLFQNLCSLQRIELSVLSKVGQYSNKYKLRLFCYQLGDQPRPNYILLICNCRHQKEQYCLSQFLRGVYIKIAN